MEIQKINDGWVRIQGVIDQRATFNQAAVGAKEFAKEYGCEVVLVRREDALGEYWVLRVLQSVALVYESRYSDEAELESDYSFDAGIEKELELERHSWVDRYGTPWSKP